MAAPKIELQNFAQSIYLTIKNRYFDDIDGEDGEVFVSQVIDWTNMFVDELETELDSEGELVDWWFSRVNGFALGTATAGLASIALPTSVDRLLTGTQRYVQVLQDGTAVSNWAVVDADSITNRFDRVTEDMCAMVGTDIVFSRQFRDTEQGGSIVGDVTQPLPRLSQTNVKLLTTVKPNLLLKLGVSKNAVLPDIVQGKLTPNYVQKFNDLLAGAIKRSKNTSRSHKASRDNFNSVRGIY